MLADRTCFDEAATAILPVEPHHACRPLVRHTGVGASSKFGMPQFLQQLRAAALDRALDLAGRHGTLVNGRACSIRHGCSDAVTFIADGPALRADNNSATRCLR